MPLQDLFKCLFGRLYREEVGCMDRQRGKSKKGGRDKRVIAGLIFRGSRGIRKTSWEGLF